MLDTGLGSREEVVNTSRSPGPSRKADNGAAMTKRCDMPLHHGSGSQPALPTPPKEVSLKYMFHHRLCCLPGAVTNLISAQERDGIDFLLEEES